MAESVSAHRFNLMNNWRRFKEKLTIWVIRFSTEARMKFWGLTNLSAADAKNVVGLLQASCSPELCCSCRNVHLFKCFVSLEGSS